MQYRMEAGLRKYTIDTLIINYSTYRANVMVKNAQLVYENDIKGMWDMDRYITLLMGEIPRLSDSTEGYGPNGKGYIAHVDIPIEVDQPFFSALEKSISGSLFFCFFSKGFTCYPQKEFRQSPTDSLNTPPWKISRVCEP